MGGGRVVALFPRHISCRSEFRALRVAEQQYRSSECLLVSCFSKGTSGCKKQKSTETGLNTKGNWMERKGAISWNPRAGSIAGDYRGSEPEPGNHSEPRQLHVHHISSLCFSLHLFSVCLFVSPPPNQLSLSQHHKVSYSTYTMRLTVWGPMHSFPDSVRESNALRARGPHPCPPSWSQNTNSSAMNRPTSRGAGEGPQSKVAPWQVSATFILPARPKWNKKTSHQT